mgnify:CR=1 FL=1
MGKRRFDPPLVCELVAGAEICTSYKDTNGNQYSTLQEVQISAPATNSQNSGGSNLLFPIIAIIIVIGACIGGWYFYVRRNKK